jgi:hypothetical protein
MRKRGGRRRFRPVDGRGPFETLRYDVGPPGDEQVRLQDGGRIDHVDFMAMADDGTLLARIEDLREGLRVTAGDVVTVGSDDAVPAQAQILNVDIDGTISLRVLGPRQTLIQSA